MATEFDLYLFDESLGDAEHAAEAAFAEIDRIERLLSFFIPNSNISRLNQSPAGEPLRLHPDTFDCLQLAKQMHRLTGGVFDPTAGALLTDRSAWDDSSWSPSVEPDERAVGLDLIETSAEHCAAARLHPGVQIDLGGIGKGFAVDLAIRLLRDRGIERANLIAGQSTMCFIGQPTRGAGWELRIRDPHGEVTQIDRIHVEQGSVSASSISDDPHVLNPGSGQADGQYMASWVVASNATESDALATALLLLDSAQAHTMADELPGLAALRIARDGQRELLGVWKHLRFKQGPTEE